nr:MULTISPECIES: ATP-binding protein [unclassified Pseudoflavonifractor]
MLILCVGFEIRWNETLFVGIVAHTMQHIWSSIMLLLCMVFEWEYEIYIANVIRFFLADGMMLATYFGLARYFEKRRTLTGDRFLLIFSVFAQLMINFLYNYTSTNDYLNLAIYFYDIAASLFLLMILYGVFSRAQLRSEAYMLERIIAESESKHRAAMENAESLDRKCHDLKHQIAALRLAPENQREDYIRELEETVHTFERLYKTGNDTLDVLLAEKQTLCVQKDIALTVLADAGGLSGISALDIYTLFGNALDNAIEAAQQVPLSTGRVICLNIARRGNLTSISLENSCARAAAFRDGLPLTTKEDAERHGFGVKSIRYIVEKYGGTMEISQSEGRFSLNIMFLSNHTQAA